VINLNDTYILDVQHLEWSNPAKQQAKPEDDESGVDTMPSPRSNCAGAHADGLVYVFGGHGGTKYQKVAFNDLWCFSLATGLWTSVEYVNTPCDPRAGHSTFIVGDKLYVYGGWNLESQFNDIAVFSLTTREWSIPDIVNESPRWNFSAVMVEAIPSWKYIVFGGEVGDFPEGGPRKFGTPVNS
jgi:dynein heavy chain, axonemal